jgi:hypothetical protein
MAGDIMDSGHPDRQGGVIGSGIPAAPQGGPLVPQGNPDMATSVPVDRSAAGPQDDWLNVPLGVESRRPRMRTFHYQRPWPLPISNSGEHGVIAPPEHAQEGAQYPQMVYPFSPLVRRPPGAWDEPLQLEGGPQAGDMPRPGEAGEAG